MLPANANVNANDLPLHANALPTEHLIQISQGGYMRAIRSDYWLNYNQIKLFSSCRRLNLTRNLNSIQMPTEPACRRQWIGSSVLRMLQIFSKETILLLLSPPSERNKQRDGECSVVHGVCAITSSSHM